MKWGSLKECAKDLVFLTTNMDVGISTEDLKNKVREKMPILTPPYIEEAIASLEKQGDIEKRNDKYKRVTKRYEFHHH